MLGPLIAAAASIGSSILNSKAQDKDRDMQTKFARNAIQWKVADARKAGIHPAIALGAQTSSFSPVAIGDTGLAQAGQDIGRAVEAYTPQSQRLSGYQEKFNQLTLQNMELQNAVLASQIMLKNQAGNPPGLPETINAPQSTPNLKAFGDVWETSPQFSDAQSFEDREGESGDWTWGPLIKMYDLIHNIKLMQAGELPYGYKAGRKLRMMKRYNQSYRRR